MDTLKTEVASFIQLVVAKPSSGYTAETTVKSLAGKTQSDQILPANSTWVWCWRTTGQMQDSSGRGQWRTVGLRQDTKCLVF